MALDPKDRKFHDINDSARWGKFEPEELFVLYDADDTKVGDTKVGDTKVEGEPS